MSGRSARLAWRLAALEQTIAILQQNYPNVPIQELAKDLPEQALQWAATTISKGDGSWPADRTRLQQAWADFVRNRGNQAYREVLKQKGNPRNPLDFTLNDLEEAKQAIQVSKGPSNREVKRQVKEEGAELILKTPGFRTIKITTPEAACIYAKETKWCTAQPGAASETLEDGPLYVTVNDQGRKVSQLHLESYQLKDAKDKPISLSLGFHVGVYRGGGDPYHKHMLQLRQKIAHPAQSPENTMAFLRAADMPRWKDAEKYIMQDPNVAAQYSYKVLRKPWPEAEPIIAKDPRAAMAYATHYWTRRLPEAEPLLMKIPEYAVEYARIVLRQRWPEAEPYILTDVASIYNYARQVIKERWPEGEKRLVEEVTKSLKGSEYLGYYFHWVLDKFGSDAAQDFVKQWQYKKREDSDA